MKRTKQKKTHLLLTATILGAFAITSTPLTVAQEEPEATPAQTETKKTETKEAEPKSEKIKEVAPEVQAEVQKTEEDKRARLVADAQTALADTRNALQALDEGKSDEALAALERVTGKLTLIVARDPNLALAPVGVSTIIRDLYAGPDTAKQAVKEAEEMIEDGKVQQARAILSGLASEAEVQVTSIPLATYPAAIQAIAPLIDAGKIDEAKAALSTALSTLIIESYVTPLPKIRAQEILKDAEKLAEKSDRTEEENKTLHDQIEAARSELKLGEVLGYGAKEDYKPLYEQLDEIQEKTKEGKSGEGFFDKIKNSLTNLKDRILD